MAAPPIDKRGYADLVATTETLAQRFSGWRPATEGGPDAAGTLIRVFGHFAELVVERINRAPDKSYLAFLNLLGVSPLPERPARVPLTFRLATNSPVDATVPAGTLVAAPPPDGEEDEVVFETERYLVVTRAQLGAVVVSDAPNDAWADRTAQAAGHLDEPFAAFSAAEWTPHELYLACDPLLTKPGRKTVTLTMASWDLWQWLNWPITWSFWDGAGWRPVAASVGAQATMDSAGHQSRWVTVTLTDVPPLPPHAVGGIEAGWLRARLGMPLPAGGSPAPPEAVAVGARAPVDPSGPLVPFPVDSTVLRFYLSGGDAFAAGGARARLRFDLSRPGVAENLVLNWSYQVGNRWEGLGGGAELRDETAGLTRDGDVSFQVPREWPLSVYRNRSGRWLRVDVAGGRYVTPPEIASVTVDHDWALPSVGDVAVSTTQTAAPEAQPPPAAYHDTAPLDLSKDFYPLGERPRFNDTFYVACPPALARPGATVRVSVTLANPAGATNPPVTVVRTQGNPVLTWEVSDGARWRAVPVADNLTADGEFTVTLPDPLAPAAVNGDERHWLRARLTAGDYGREAGYEPDKDGNYGFVPANLAPPVVSSLRFSPVVGDERALVSACLGYNDFAYTDHTAAASTGRTAFAPFAPTADTEPALYLGLDRPPEPRPLTLYLQVEPPRPEEVAADRLAEVDPASSGELAWEYAGPAGWHPLAVADETGSLGDRGLVQFVAPADLTRRAHFGQSLYWLRVRWRRGDFPLPPRLRRILLNTTWAAQATTVSDEILGSSTGDPDQSFRSSNAPVLPGQRVLVREPEPPPAAEHAALAAVEGDDAVTVTTDDAGQPDEVWVRWHAVADLHASGPRDRHYLVDSVTGEVRFGDGSSGMIPPVGQSNVRISYRTGGGERGNRPAGTIAKLKAGLPYVDGVANAEPADGGGPREPLERVAARGPRTLRHRDRAVTAQDLEDLALDASAQVARVAAITPMFNPSDLWLDRSSPALREGHAVDAGRVGVIVVPADPAARPTPSVGLLRTVHAYLAARCPATADLWVAGPEWIAATVTATVVPAAPELADAVGDRVLAEVERFLHPLTGGPDGQGWAFGRKPHRSGLIALVEAVEGVDSVTTLDVDLRPETDDLDRLDELRRLLNRRLGQAADPTDVERDPRRWLERALVYSGRHEITVALG
jgi:hypothetical protein